jgi:hypothetical protein
MVPQTRNKWPHERRWHAGAAFWFNAIVIG